MQTIITNLTTKAVFSEDGTKRYSLQKTWDNEKPSLAIIMLAPSEAAGVALDSTTLLVLNNASRLGYGSVAVLNLFATLNDFGLKQAEAEDAENLKVIVALAEKADAVVYAPGVGKAKNKAFQVRQTQVLEVLKPMESKLYCLCDEGGKARFQHPLSPAVRTWYLSPLKVSELLPSQVKPEEEPSQPQQKKKRKTTRIVTQIGNKEQTAI